MRPALLVALLAACAGSEPAPRSTCAGELSSFEACGGDVVGTWSLAASCDEADAFHETTYRTLPGCEGTEASASEIGSGTLSFDSGGTTTRHLAITRREVVRFEATCLATLISPAGDPAEDCALMTLGSGGDERCTFAAGICTCTATFDQRYEGSGPYDTAGGTVSGLDLPYCVKDGRLLLLLSPADRPPHQLAILDAR